MGARNDSAPPGVLLVGSDHTRPTCSGRRTTVRLSAATSPPPPFWYCPAGSANMRYLRCLPKSVVAARMSADPALPSFPCRFRVATVKRFFLAASRTLVAEVLRCAFHCLRACLCCCTLLASMGQVGRCTRRSLRALTLLRIRCLRHAPLLA